MANLHNYHGRYCEAEFESTFLSYLEEAGWSYLAGSSLPRSSMRDVLYTDDMEFFLNRTNPYTETGSACVCAAAFRKISCTLPGGQSRPPIRSRTISIVIGLF